MIKITIDARMIFMSGIGRYIREVLNVMASHKELTINCLYQIKDEIKIKNLEFYNNCNWIPMRSEIFSILEQFEMPIKAPHSDIFWSPQYNVPIILPNRVRERVVTIHDVFQLYDFKNLSIAKKVYVLLMINYSTWISQKIITVSKFSKREIIKSTYFAKHKVECIYNGINADFAKDIEIQKLDNPYILMVGNVKPHKNLSIVIKAFIQIEYLIPHTLIIVGKKEGFITGDQKAFLMAEGHPRISFTGSITDAELKKLYNSASLFVFPSLYEGFGLPILEAMSFSLPIIASDIEVTRELFGDSIKYFKPYSVDDISECIIKALKKPFEIKGYSEILSRFTWTHTAEKHIKIFNELIQSHS
jgi:glycosyltransferase involved in cell wall biosynthesis